MSITWTEIDYKIKEWTEYRDIGDLLALECDVQDAIKKIIDKNRTEFETKDKNKLLESLGLNDITKHNKSVRFDYDFHSQFKFRWDKDDISIFKSIVEHWLNGDIIVSVYTEEAEVNVMYFYNIEKFHITNNDILIEDEFDNDISFTSCNFFAIQNNNLIPLHIRFREEKCKMTDVFEQVEYHLKRKINGCDRNITFGDFTSCKISTVKIR